MFFTLFIAAIGCATEGPEQVCVQKNVLEKLTYFSRILTKLGVRSFVGVFLFVFPQIGMLGLESSESLNPARSLKMMDKFGRLFRDIQ